MTDLDYIHILFDDHEIIFAEGAPSESLLLGAEAKRAISVEAMEEINLIFPDIINAHQESSSALIPASGKQTQLVARLRKNKKPALENYAYNPEL